MSVSQIRCSRDVCRKGVDIVRASFCGSEFKTIEMVAVIITRPDPQAEAWGE